MPQPSRADDRLVIAPSQPRAGSLLIRLLGDVDQRDVARCTRVLHGAVDAAAAERTLRGARARVVCDVREVDSLGGSGRSVLADARSYARRHGVDFTVVSADDPAGGDTARDDLPPTVPAAR